MVCRVRRSYREGDPTWIDIANDRKLWTSLVYALFHDAKNYESENGMFARVRAQGLRARPSCPRFNLRSPERLETQLEDLLTVGYDTLLWKHR